MQASEAQTPTGKGFDTYFGYFDGYNDYLHSLSGTVACPNRPGTVTFRSSAADGPKCTGSSVIARHLTSAIDLWLNDHPAHGLNGTGFEEALFLERVLGGAANSRGTLGVLDVVPQDPLAPRRGLLGPSPDRESAAGNAPVLVPGPLTRL